MVKFENRVARAKIKRFIEKDSLVLFLNGKCDDSSQEEKKRDFRKKLTRSLDSNTAFNAHVSQLLQSQTLLDKKTEIKKRKQLIEVSDLTFEDSSKKKDIKGLLKQSFTFKKPQFYIKSVKNKHLKTALLNEEEHPSNTNHSTLALTQANTLVITLPPSAFFLLKDLKQNNNLSILGGTYENCNIDSHKLSRLTQIIENDQIYYNLNAILKKNLFSFIETVDGATFKKSVLSSISKNLCKKLCFTIDCSKKDIVKP